MRRENIFLPILILVLSGCSTAHLSLHSNPSNAQVYIKPVGHKEFSLVGHTPLNVEAASLGAIEASTGAVQIEVRKDGYKPDLFFITEIDKISLNIIRDLRPLRDLENQAWLNHQVESMFEITRLTQAQRYDEALRLAREIKRQLPTVSTIHELEAGVLLLKHEYRLALDAYRLAVKYNPESLESVRMVRHLEKTYGYPPVIDYSEIDQDTSRKLREEMGESTRERLPASEDRGSP